MDQRRTVLYMHAGSGNHGCEAIVNSTCHMLQEKVDVLSARPEEDARYSLGNLCELRREKRMTEHFWPHLYYFAKRLLTRDPMCYIQYRFREILEKPYAVAVSIGGDNYCYPEQVEDLMLLNRALNERGSITILWGASVEPALLKRSDVVADMQRYSHIFAREKVTYQALLQAGIAKNRLHLYPDPAFCLQKKEALLPKGFAAGNTVGINMSPMIIDKESAAGMTLRNYRRLIGHILSETDMCVALLPHVVWDANDDRRVLHQLYEEFGESGRVILLEDCDCMTLKGYIARMRFLVAARTHASIAAYATKVPTLVVGYSVKAEGIAQDLFGSKEHYVLPVQQLRQEQDLWQAFQWLYEHEQEVRELLESQIGAYISKAQEGGRLLRQIIRENIS